MMEIWYAITLLGDPLLWIILTAVFTIVYIFFLRRMIPKKRRKIYKRIILLLLVSLSLTLITINMLKIITRIPRPCIPCPGDECNPYCPPSHDYSFPSGHAGTIFTIFTALFFATKKKRYLILYVIPLLISYSRIALGVHTYTDIVGGAFIGIIFVYIADRILKNAIKTYNS